MDSRQHNCRLKAEFQTVQLCFTVAYWQIANVMFFSLYACLYIAQSTAGMCLALISTYHYRSLHLCIERLFLLLVAPLFN